MPNWEPEGRDMPTDAEVWEMERREEEEERYYRLEQARTYFETERRSGFVAAELLSGVNRRRAEDILKKELGWRR